MSPLHVESTDGVTVVTIDHPPTNLVDGTLIGALIALLDEIETVGGTRVLLFRSADPDFFLMHGDVEAILAAPTREAEPVTTANIAAATFQRLSAAPFVTIGLLDGAARGGGCELLSALDFRFGSPRAVIGQPEVAMAILPGAGGTARWPRLVGRSQALEILLTGRDVSADEAFAIGWLHALAPSDRLEADAMALARRIAAMPPSSVAAIKRVVDISLVHVDAALVAESGELADLMRAGGHHEPMRRFLDAGGQTREGETTRLAAIVDAMLGGNDGGGTPCST